MTGGTLCSLLLKIHIYMVATLRVQEDPWLLRQKMCAAKDCKLDYLGETYTNFIMEFMHVPYSQEFSHLLSLAKFFHRDFFLFCITCMVTPTTLAKICNTKK